MSNLRSPVARINWESLSPAAKALVRMFAASPVWRLTSFVQPPAECLEELLAAAWNSSHFTEPELRDNPEVVVAAVKMLVANQLRPN